MKAAKKTAISGNQPTAVAVVAELAWLD